MRLGDVTQKLKDNGDKALVAFLTAGYPNEKTFVDLVLAAAAAGCDLIEIGVPFSDPIADGPVIQESSQRALENGMSLARCIELAGELSSKIEPPLVLMGYYNPILRMGLTDFAARAQEASVAGTIVPDVPIEESEEIRGVLRSHALTFIDLVAPTSGEARIERIAAGADGFLYLVSVTGVTGVRSPREQDTEAFVARVRRFTDRPLYLGFGINTAERAREAARVADGVIIGSALIQCVAKGTSHAAGVAAVSEFLTEVRETLNTL